MSHPLSDYLVNNHHWSSFAFLWNIQPHKSIHEYPSIQLVILGKPGSGSPSVIKKDKLAERKQQRKLTKDGKFTSFRLPLFAPVWFCDHFYWTSLTQTRWRKNGDLIFLGIESNVTCSNIFIKTGMPTSKWEPLHITLFTSTHAGLVWAYLCYKSDFFLINVWILLTFSMLENFFPWRHKGSGINYYSRSGFHRWRQFLRLISRLIFLSVHLICSFYL